METNKNKKTQRMTEHSRHIRDNRIITEEEIKSKLGEEKNAVKS